MTIRQRCPWQPGFSGRLRPCGWLLCLAVTLAAVSLGPTLVLAEAAAKEKIPAPVELGGNDLPSDGVQLAATYYPGTKGKESVPVILLHMFKGSRRDYAGLASFLQRKGYAVLVPDLRGHGDSTRIFGYGSSRKLKADKMPSDQFRQMVYGDMETLWRFLLRKNDAGELNLSSLCIVGAEMGAAVAVYYAAYDWSRTVREARILRPIPDVKALVLISPEWAFPGLPLSKPLNHPAVRSRLSIYILVGNGDPRSVSDARRVHNLLSRFHPDSENVASKALFFKSFPTKLQGTKMLGIRELQPSPEVLISKFIELRVVKQDFPWRLRGDKPLEGGDP